MWPFTCTWIKMELMNRENKSQEKLVIFTNPEFINPAYLPTYFFKKRGFVHVLFLQQYFLPGKSSRPAWVINKPGWCFDTIIALGLQ